MRSGEGRRTTDMDSKVGPVNSKKTEPRTVGLERGEYTRPCTVKVRTYMKTKSERRTVAARKR